MASNQDIIENIKKIRNLASTRDAPVNNDILSCLKEITNRICKKQTASLKSLDDLSNKARLANVEVSNIINEFQMIANQQFVENRVYEEDITDIISNRSGSSTYHSSSTISTPVEDTCNTKISTDERTKADDNITLNSIIEKSLQFIDRRFIVHAKSEESSSSKASLHNIDEQLDQITLPNANRYSTRKLPYLIGCEDYISDNLVGLGPASPKDMSSKDKEEDEASESRDLGEYNSDEENSFSDEFASMSQGQAILFPASVPTPKIEPSPVQVEQRQENSTALPNKDHNPPKLSNHEDSPLFNHPIAHTMSDDLTDSTKTLHQVEDSSSRTFDTKGSTESDGLDTPHLQFQKTLQDQLSRHLQQRASRIKSPQEDSVDQLVKDKAIKNLTSSPKPQPSKTIEPSKIIESPKIIQPSKIIATKAPEVAPRRSLSVTSSNDNITPVRQTEMKSENLVKATEKNDRISNVLKKYSELFENDDSDSSSDSGSNRNAINRNIVGKTTNLKVEKKISSVNKADTAYDESDDSSGSDLFVKKYR